MKSIAITGANSFVGQHLVRSLLKRNDIQLRLLIHENNNTSLCNTYNTLIIKGDLLQQETLDGFVSPDCTVINLVYLGNSSEQENLAAMDNLGSVCAKAGIKRLIHCSTAVVVGRTSENVIDEETECNPISQYEVTKLVIEKLLIEKYSDLFEIIILRPTAVFGPGGKNLLKLANSLVKGSLIINYLKSCLFSNRRMNLVCIENVVAAIDFLIHYERNIKTPETFIISDDEDLSNNYRNTELSLMRYFGYRDYVLPVVPIPLNALSFLLKLVRRTNLNPSSIHSCQKLLECGYEKTVSLHNSLDRFAEWYKINFIDEHRQGLRN